MAPARKNPRTRLWAPEAILVCGGVLQQHSTSYPVANAKPLYWSILRALPSMSVRIFWENAAEQAKVICTAL